MPQSYKGMIFDIMKELDGVELTAPVTVGQIVIENVCGTGVDVVSARTMGAQ